jgi:hypothetical protein
MVHSDVEPMGAHALAVFDLLHAADDAVSFEVILVDVVADDAATQWRSPEPRTAQNRGDFVSSCAQCNELADRASPVVVANFAGGDLEGGETPSPRVVPTPWGLLLQPASNADAAVTLLLLRVLMRRVTEVVLAIATKRCWESGSGSTAMRKRPTHPSHNPNPNPNPGQTDLNVIVVSS